MKKQLFTFLLLTLFSQGIIFAQDYVLEFDGANSRVKYPNDTTMDMMNGATDYTIEAWFKPTSDDIHNNVIIKRWYQFAITMYQDTNKRVYFTHYADGGGTTTYINSSYNAFNLDAWNHVAVINNSSENTLKIFVNGIDVTADSDGNPITQTAIPLDAAPGADANLYIGYGGSGTVPFAYIDKVRIKKTAENIASLQTAVTDADYTTDADTAALFFLNEGTGDTTLNEASGANANLECAGGCSEIPTWVLLANTMSTTENTIINFSVYPNPVTNGVFTVKAGNNETIQAIEIVNILGQTVKTMVTETTVNSVNVNVDALASGNYFVNTTTNVGSGVQKLIIK